MSKSTILFNFLQRKMKFLSVLLEITQFSFCTKAASLNPISWKHYSDIQLIYC